MTKKTARTAMRRKQEQRWEAM